MLFTKDLCLLIRSMHLIQTTLIGNSLPKRLLILMLKEPYCRRPCNNSLLDGRIIDLLLDLEMQVVA